MDKLQARRQTLWDQSFESDACGMGFIAQIDGKPTHELVDYAMTILERMNHRGGTGAEPDTGDGAGALFAMPHEFFTKIATENSITLPNSGDYAVGQFFLPKASDKKAALCKSIRNEMQADGYQILMTRDVPFNFDNCGPGAQAIMPSFVQFIISKPTDSKSGRDFEDRLYRLRRKLEKTFATSEMFICSLSSKTIVYKGMLHAFQVRTFYPDLSDPAFKSTIALTHSRFSTNTFPSWDRAQPFRFLAHNGEINTLRGAENWMTSHKIEIYNEENSDSAKLENCLEYLYRNGREMPHALLMMIPEAWGKEAGLSPELTSFYEYTSSFMAPWDGPAALVFTDGDTVGARLDRNGLRPSRYSITKDNFIVCSSESGVVDFEPSRVVEKGVLGPGNMMLVDTVNGKILRNEEVKKHYAAQFPYEKWLEDNLLHIDDLTEKAAFDAISEEDRQTMHKLFGYTEEVIRTVIVPMAENGQEPVIAMGYDSPLAVLSQKNQSLFTYFKQQFAQVTNPPIDAIREKIVVGTEVYLGRDGDLRVDHDENCVKLKLDSPVLTTEDFEKIAALSDQKHQAQTISTLYDVTKDTPNRLEHALVDMFKVVEAAVDKGASIIILSDRDQKEGLMPMPILLATSGLYNYMVEKGKGSQFSIVVDTAEVNEVHHFATIVGYGASAIHPYGAYETLKDYNMSDKAESFRQAAEKGIIKVMSRMGISTVSGYKGAQLFEAVGLSDAVVDKYFRGTVTRISGLTLKQIEAEYLERYEFAYGHRSHETLPSGGSFQFKADGEHHIFNPLTIYNFQKAVRQGDYDLYKAYSAELDLEADETPSNLRHIWELKGERTPVALSEVEPVENIVKRFKVGAMSFGSLSKEAHETIAAAMNSIGAKSNSGEG
ncbi:MAG: glutamate synthase central domain-containing protein, partial [Pseudolactococcus laudensis]